MSIFTKLVVAKINENIEALIKGSRSFQRRQLYGVATKQAGDVYGVPNVGAPYVFNSDGEGVFTGVDDAYDFLVYHKAGAMTASASKGYGDQNKELTVRADMSLVIYYDESKICFSPDEMTLILMPAFFGKFVLPDIQNCFINLGTASFDKEAVFASEFRLVPFKLSAEQQFFRVSYTIEGSYKIGCLNICD